MNLIMKEIKVKSVLIKSNLPVSDYSVNPYTGFVSGYKVPDKFVRAGFHATKSQYVNAPLIDEYPLTMKCELMSIEKGNGCL